MKQKNKQKKSTDVFGVLCVCGFFLCSVDCGVLFVRFLLIHNKGGGTGGCAGLFPFSLLDQVWSRAQKA